MSRSASVKRFATAAVLYLLTLANLAIASHSLSEPHSELTNLSANPQPVGIGQGGTFLALGNNTVFLEGVNTGTLQGIAYQGLLGGMVPGLLLGSRPFVNHVLQQSYPSHLSNIPHNAYHFLSHSAAVTHYAAKAFNLQNFYQAGAWYAIPSVISSLMQHHDDISDTTGALTQWLGMATGLFMNRLGLSLSREQTPRQIFLSREDGQQLFIQIRSQFTEARVTAVEIHRVKLGSTSEPRIQPLGKLAAAMDSAGTDILFLIPQTTPAGNHLSFSFSTQDEQGQLQVHSGTVILNYGDKAFAPWLETLLHNWSTAEHETPPVSSLISVFQEDILKHVSTLLTCLHQDSCPSGHLDTTGQNLVYTPSKSGIAGQVNIQRSFLTDEQQPLDIPGDMLLYNENGSLTLSSRHDNFESSQQYWIPSWITSAAVAEITAAVRASAQAVTQAGLYTLAAHKNISTNKPLSYTEASAASLPPSPQEQKTIDQNQRNIEERLERIRQAEDRLNNERETLREEQEALQREQENLKEESDNLKYERLEIAELQRSVNSQSDQNIQTRQQLVQERHLFQCERNIRGNELDKRERALEIIRHKLEQDKEDFAERERELEQFSRELQQFNREQNLERLELEEIQRLAIRPAWLLSDNINNEIEQSVLETLTEEQESRFRQIIQASGRWNRGKIVLVKQGMRNEILSSPERQKLHTTQRVLSRHNNPLAPVSYATFEGARDRTNKNQPVSHTEQYPVPLYAGGVVADLPRKETSDPCIICQDETLTQPLFSCGNGRCSAGMHLHCLDGYFRSEARKAYGTKNWKSSIICPHCQQQSIPGQAKWFLELD